MLELSDHHAGLDKTRHVSGTGLTIPNSSCMEQEYTQNTKQPLSFTVTLDRSAHHSMLFTPHSHQGPHSSSGPIRAEPGQRQKEQGPGPAPGSLASWLEQVRRAAELGELTLTRVVRESGVISLRCGSGTEADFLGDGSDLYFQVSTTAARRLAFRLMPPLPPLCTGRGGKLPLTGLFRGQGAGRGRTLELAYLWVHLQNGSQLGLQLLDP